VHGKDGARIIERSGVSLFNDGITTEMKSLEPIEVLDLDLERLSKGEELGVR
jgi:hypothetical protein